MFTLSELPVTVMTLAMLAALMLVRDNRRALLVMHGMIAAGAATLGVATLAFQADLLSPLAWMSLTGAGLYLAYTPFNAMLFDRMIAAIGTAANAGFLIYIADSLGYAGSVAMLLMRSIAAPQVEWFKFFERCSYATALVVVVLTGLSALRFLSPPAEGRRHATP